jgi:hypothetical protein
MNNCQLAISVPMPQHCISIDYEGIFLAKLQAPAYHVSIFFFYKKHLLDNNAISSSLPLKRKS